MKFAAAAFAATLALGAVSAAHAQPAQAADNLAHDIGHRVAQTGRATGHAVADGGREVGHATAVTGRHITGEARHVTRRRHHVRHHGHHALLHRM